MSHKMILGYWKARGKGEPIRLMLNYLGVPYNEVNYYNSDTKSDWYASRDELGIPFVNLPYFIDGDVKLTECLAIMRYLARKHNNLYPENDEENTKCDQIQGVLSDVRKSITTPLYDQETHEKSKAVFLAAFPRKMGEFEKWLGNSLWLAGDRLTYVDFFFAELVLSCVDLWIPGILKPYPLVCKYKERFEALEAIDKYKKSSRFSTFPLLRKSAVFGGKSE